ncbi:MAG: hypothetical protein HZB38_07600 [Planctomycetes bacterium]|nr:hypothetical protein [Planctomycetota bacterium]
MRPFVILLFALAVAGSLLLLMRGRVAQTPIVPAAPPSSAPATAPAEPPTSAPTTMPAAVPELPPYVRILETTGHGDAKLDADAAGPDVLNLKTAGVKRIKLLRTEWPHPTRGSIAVRIDGLGIEWTARREVLELERLDNGDWLVIPEPKRP